MPIYEYACSQCGKINDVLQKVNDPAPEACEACSARGTLTKMLSRSSFVLKGGGWYSDLYGSVKKDGDAKSSASPVKSADSSSAAPASTSTAASAPAAPAPKAAAAD